MNEKSGERLGRISGISFVVSLAVMYGTNWGVPGILRYEEEFRLLDMQFGYSYETVTTMVERIGEQGISHYLQYFVVDFIFILSLMVVQGRLSDAVIAKRSLSKRRLPNENYKKQVAMKYMLIGLTITRGLLDLVEDFLLGTMLKEVLPLCKMNVGIASACTRLKFVVLFLWGILIVGLLVYRSIAGRKVCGKNIV